MSPPTFDTLPVDVKDLRAEVRELRALLVEMRDEMRSRVEQLRPLDAILGKNRKAAAAQIARDAGLRALGIPSGKRLVFRPSEVTAYLRSRGAR